MSTVIGIILVICTWSAAGCIACKPRFWHIMGGGYLLVGVFDFMTLVFLRSSVCTKHGCQFGYGAAMAILAGVFWFTTASLCFVTAVKDIGAKNMLIKSRVEIKEYIEPNGVRITETTTTKTSGTTVIQRTIRRPPVHASSKEMETSCQVIGGGSFHSDIETDPTKDKGE